MRLTRTIAFVVALCGAAACQSESGADCWKASDCPTGQICLDNFCLDPPDGRNGGGTFGVIPTDAGADTTADAGLDVADDAETSVCDRLVVTPNPVDLGSSSGNDDLTGGFTLRNGTGAAVSITSVRSSSPLIAVDAPLAESLPITIAAGRTSRVDLRQIARAGEVAAEITVGGAPCSLTVAVTGITR
ncbi:MAG: hypothetical protein H6698_05760 [Myxococcales bacterium]|nr:hypothetical protein [Myxococcales bacterium]MCB9533810.1 hypothetical protein [Myxococcales bacterium]